MGGVVAWCCGTAQEFKEFISSQQSVAGHPLTAALATELASLYERMAPAGPTPPNNDTANPLHWAARHFLTVRSSPESVV